ncbi:hypothetical protein A9Q99_11790 [Gammaproteobacteria bacterium 45_16_T64]|nr:hypothetical protein A9Q99_11790 [Gammaproteobacteria bacterium 45_16_T64]
MKFLTAILFVLITSTSAYAAESYSTSVSNQSNEPWFIQRVLAYPSAEGTRVSGRVTAAKQMGIIDGHVDVVALSPEGKKITETTIALSTDTLTRQRKMKGGVRFSANIPQQLPANSRVKLSFHKNTPAVENAPMHASNIAN